MILCEWFVLIYFTPYNYFILWFVLSFVREKGNKGYIHKICVKTLTLQNINTPYVKSVFPP